MYQYIYPQITGGYRFNLMERCRTELLIAPESIADTTFNGQIKTVIQFTGELSDILLSGLNALISGSGGAPQYPPFSSGKTVFYVKDLYATFPSFIAAAGISGLRLFYSESVFGSGNIDRLEIHADDALSAQQRNKIKAAYGDLIIERV